MMARRISGATFARSLTALLILQGAGFADAQDDPVWLHCQLDGGRTVCTKNEPLALSSIQDRYLVPYRMPQPEFPPRLRNLGLEGCVIVGFSVDQAGRTADVEILQTVHEGRFDVAARSTVEQYRFHPLQSPFQSIAVRVCFALR